jgi:hypothetical protein
MSVAIGSFAGTLRDAIDRRGLGLERVRERLEQRGVTVSVATLSYWQSGRSVPSRRSSLAALPHLEEVLGLDQGCLARSLPVTRDRPRRTIVPGLDVLWPEPPATRLLGLLDTRWDEHLDRLVVHEVVRIGADRRQLSLTVRQVLRARTDGPDRQVVMHCHDDADVALPELRAVRGCRTGRIERDEAHGVIGAELLFPSALQRGDTAIVEYDLVCASPGPYETRYTRRLRTRMREYLLEIDFHPGQPPATVHQLSEDDEVASRLDAPHHAHLVVSDPLPGTMGLSWTWAGAQAPVGAPASVVLRVNPAR